MRGFYLLGVLLVVALFTSGCDKKEQTVQERAAVQKNVIIDDAYVLLDDEKLMKMYREYNENLLDEYDIDFRVVTTLSKEDIDTFANKQFSKLQKESRSKSGKALLLVINTLQDKVRLEVSMALEPVFTDAFVSYTERKGFVPYFRDYKIADGVYMATELVHDRATEAAQGKEFVPPMQSKSIGGGAKSKAQIGVTDLDAKKGAQITANMTNKPMDVMKRYLEVLKVHNKNPNLNIYTDTTKSFFRKWTVTEINQDHEIHNITPCKAHYETLYDTKNEHAVLAVRPYDKHRTCSPYFFKKEDGKWKLDIATMAQILRFNAQMQGHFDMSKRLEKEGMYYAYAFDGYTFGKNGYLFKPKHPKEEGMRWGYQCNGWFKPQEANLYKKNKEKYIRCWINKYWQGSPAEVRLGLDVYDYVVAVGDDGQDANYKTFMAYMKQVPSGEVVTVIVNHYDSKTKQTTHVVRHGIAP